MALGGTILVPLIAAISLQKSARAIGRSFGKDHCRRQEDLEDRRCFVAVVCNRSSASTTTLNGRIETERNRRRFEIVVDRFRVRRCSCCQPPATVAPVTSERRRQTELSTRCTRGPPGIFLASAIFFARNDRPQSPRGRLCNEMAAISGTKIVPPAPMIPFHSLRSRMT